MLKPRRDQVVAWRGPMLDRALVQMLADVYWGDLDVLLLDLPPGTGDVAISLGQHLPGAEVVVVTTPQEAAAEVAERAGTMASMMHQRVVGVVENMSYLPCPHCAAEGKDHRLEIFGTGGGDRVAATLSQRFGYDVPVLGRIPLDPSLREGGDAGKPIVESDPTAPGGRRCSTEIADTLAGRGRGLAGMQLGLTPDQLSSDQRVRGRAAGAGGHRVRRGPRLRPRQAARVRPAGRPVSLRKVRDFANTARDELRDRARPGVRRPRAARPRPAHDRPQAHRRGDGGAERRGPAAARARGAAAARRRRGPAVRRRGDLSAAQSAALDRGERRRTPTSSTPVAGADQPRRSPRRPGAATPSCARAVAQVDHAPLARLGEPAQRRAQAEPGERRPRHLGHRPAEAPRTAATAARRTTQSCAGAADQAPAVADPLQPPGDRADADDARGRPRSRPRPSAGWRGVTAGTPPGSGRPARRRARRRRAPRPALEVVEQREQLVLPAHGRTLRASTRAVDDRLTPPTQPSVD